MLYTDSKSSSAICEGVWKWAGWKPGDYDVMLLRLFCSVFSLYILFCLLTLLPASPTRRKQDQLKNDEVHGESVLPPQIIFTSSQSRLIYTQSTQIQWERERESNNNVWIYVVLIFRDSKADPVLASIQNLTVGEYPFVFIYRTLSIWFIF